MKASILVIASCQIDVPFSEVGAYDGTFTAPAPVESKPEGQRVWVELTKAEFCGNSIVFAVRDTADRAISLPHNRPQRLCR
jgi:hypothetical protein